MSHVKTIAGFIILSGGAWAIWYALQRRKNNGGLFSSEVVETAPPRPSSETFSEAVNVQFEKTLKTWTTPPNGQKYESDFKAASAFHGLPDGLLSRVAYQESRYNPKAKSPVGAIGLMQFMPQTAKDFGIDPLDATASIYAAAKYLKQLYNKFGNWKEAVAAYNWGQGNVARKGLDKAPQETRNYFAQILTDIGLA